MKTILFLTISTYFMLFFGAFGLILPVESGEIYALVLGALIICLVGLFSDKFFLAFSRGKRMQGNHDLSAEISNLSVVLKIPEPQVYISFEVIPNVYAIDSWLGEKALVFHPYALENLTKEERRELVHIGLEKLKTRQARWLLYSGFLHLIVSAPFHFLNTNIVTRPLAYIYSIYLQQFTTLKNSLVMMYRSRTGQSKGLHRASIVFKKASFTYQVSKGLFYQMTNDFGILNIHDTSLSKSISGGLDTIRLKHLKSQMYK
jgi:hypothetical protein